jgi:chromosome segregation ATPase
MSVLTPVQVERGILELIADPSRAKELLDLIRQAEAAEARARDAKAEADAAMKVAADTLAEARAVQDVNTKKSGALRDQAQLLGEQANQLKAEHEQNKASLAEWEGRLRAQQEQLNDWNGRLEQFQRDLIERDEALMQKEAAAQEIIARAEAIKAAMG